jgi:hypothetical protein
LDRSLQNTVLMAENQSKDKKQMHSESKVQWNNLKKTMASTQGCSEQKAARYLQGASSILYGGLMPEKKDSDGRPVLNKDGATKKYSATEMAMRANPDKSKKQVTRNGLQALANAPLNYATLLQRLAVAHNMSKGTGYREAHKKVAESGAIDVVKLFGLDDLDDPDCQEFADLMFNPSKGIEHYAQIQLAVGP